MIQRRTAIRRRRPVEKEPRTRYLEELDLEGVGTPCTSPKDPMYDYAVLCEPCSPGGSLPGPRSLERKGRPTTRDLWDSMGWNYVYDQPRRKLRAKVSYSYTPANDDELRLDVGDLVEVLKQEEEGWWEGMVNGKTGMFPSNFVEVVPGEQEPEEPKTPVANNVDKNAKRVKGVGLGDIFKDGPINLRPTVDGKPTTDGKTTPTPAIEDKVSSLKRNVKPPPALPPKDISENKKVERARVLFSYVAENEDELSITEGDILIILEKELEDSGWWKGELNGKVGVFPDNFVDILPPEENKPKKPPPPSISKPSDARPSPATDKPKQDERKPAPALPTKKPAMPPPPISKKPFGQKHPTDLIAQTDDHKVKESQKETGTGRGMVKHPLPLPKVRPGKQPAPSPLVHTEPPKPKTRNVEEIDLNSVPTAGPLSHLTADRVKAPADRRPPTMHRENEEIETRSRGGVSRPAPPLPRNEPPPSPSPPMRSPASRDSNDLDSAPGAPTPDLLQAIADLRRELDTIRATSVPRTQYEALEKEVIHLRESTSKLEKLTTVLMNDIDEGAKERRSMQVEIDRVRKLSMLPSNPGS